jgi:hypothetical protein
LGGPFDAVTPRSPPREQHRTKSPARLIFAFRIVAGRASIDRREEDFAKSRIAPIRRAASRREATSDS